jgi:hypothetical protein
MKILILRSMRQSVYKCTCNNTAKDGYLRTVQYGFCGGISVEDLAHDIKVVFSWDFIYL